MFVFVLFNDGQENASLYSDTVKAFTNGIYLDDISGLKKTVKRKYWIGREEDEQWYVDKHGVLTNKSKNAKPLTKYTIIEEEIDFAHHPEEFTKIDVMKYKQGLILQDTKYNDCMMYEFDMYNFIDMESSEYFDSGKNKIKIRPNGIVKTLSIDMKNAKEFNVSYDANGSLDVFYSFDGKKYNKLKKNNKNEKNHSSIYIAFKNSSKDAIKLYAYQVLLKVE